MITAHSFKGEKVGVFGLGKAGEATVAALLAGGAEVFAWDDRYQESGVGNQVSDKNSSVTCYLSPYVEWPWKKLTSFIPAPGVPHTHPAVQMAKKQNVPVIGDIEILYRSQPKARYIGITGTNGKSTTTTLIGHILKSCGVTCEIGGNLGTAALSLAPLGAEGTCVLELSSYQLDLVATTRFNIAVFLNITPDHLDRHGDMAGYIAAKKHIFDHQTKDDVAVIAVDDAYTRQIAGDGCRVSGGAKIVQVSSQRELEQGIYVQKGILSDTCHLPPVTYDISGIASLTGEHNWQNAAASYAVARACGIAPEKIIAAMKTFPGLRHRMQLVATIKGVRFINDSKATNADAVQHALKPYNNIYWIAGGKAKAGGIEPLVPLFSHVVHAFLIGEAEAEFAKTLEGKVPYTRCGTLEVAVQKAAEAAFARSPNAPGASEDGVVVLLSPACASFDQFNSFEHRGDVFCALVESLQNGA